MKKIFSILCLILGNPAWSAINEAELPAATTSTAIIPYTGPSIAIDLPSRIRTFLNIQEPRTLYPWEASKALCKAASEGNIDLLQHLVTSSTLRLTATNFLQALLKSIQKGQNEAVEILLTSSTIGNLTVADMREAMEGLQNPGLPGFNTPRLNDPGNRRLCLFFHRLPTRLPSILARRSTPNQSLNIPVQAYQELGLFFATREGFTDIINLTPNNLIHNLDPMVLVRALSLASATENMEIYQYLKDTLDLNHTLHRQFLFFAAARMGDLNTLNSLLLLPEERESIAHLVLIAAATASAPATTILYGNAEGELLPQTSRHILETLLMEGSRFQITLNQIASFLIRDLLIGDTNLKDINPEAARILYERILPNLSMLIESVIENSEQVNIAHLANFLARTSHWPMHAAYHERCIDALTTDQLDRLFFCFPSASVVSAMRRKGASHIHISTFIKSIISQSNLWLETWPSELVREYRDEELIKGSFSSIRAYEDNSDDIRTKLRFLLKGASAAEKEIILGEAYGQALRSGSVELIHELRALIPPSRHYPYGPAIVAVANNDLDTFRRIQTPIRLDPGHSHVALDRAAIQGNLEPVATHIIATGSPSISTLINWGITSLKHDQEHNLRYLEPKFPSIPVDLNSLPDTEKRYIATIRAYLAAADGNVDALRRNIELILATGSLEEEEAIIRKAITNGHLNIVRYFAAENEENLPHGWNVHWPTYIASAAENNQVHILKYLLMHPDTLEELKPAHIGNAMLVATQNNALATLPMLVSFFEGHAEFPGYAKEAYKIAAYHGAKDALRLLSRYVPTSIHSRAIPLAVRGTQIELVQELLRSMVEPGLDLSMAAMITAAHTGQWEILQRLLIGHKSQILTTYTDAATAGHHAATM